MKNLIYERVHLPEHYTLAQKFTFKQADLAKNIKVNYAETWFVSLHKGLYINDVITFGGVHQKMTF